MTEKSKQMAIAKLDQPVDIETDSGNFQLTINQVKNFVAKGSISITTQEAFQFLQLCRFNNLNPWVGDAYLIKFGNECSMVTSKSAYMKRAERAGDKYDGFEAGIIVESSEDIIRLNGSLFINNGENKIIGGWAKVYRSDRKYPISVEVSFDEYVGLTKEGKVNRMWRTKPATMIRKVALCQALREAFPDIYQGMISEEEIGQEFIYDGPPIDIEPITTEITEPANEPSDENSKPKSRRRRQEQEYKGETIKTSGITGKTLKTIANIETNHEEAEKLIDKYLKDNGISELTFLTDEEGKALLSLLMGTLGTAKEEPETETEENAESDNQNKGKIACPDRGDIEIEVSFCEQSCPKSADKTCIHYQ